MSIRLVVRLGVGNLVACLLMGAETWAQENRLLSH